MSVAISYDDLSDAAKSAKKVANYFDDYADELQSRVLNKMATYDGTWTSNMSSAYGDVSTKINAMKTMSTAFETYQKSLEGLRDTCESTDEAVKSKVASLTSEFKENNGIRDSKVENFCAYILTSLGNSTSVGRYLGNSDDARGMQEDYINQQIKVWYNFEGGKDFIKGLVVGVLEVAAAVLSVVVLALGTVTGVLEIIAAVATVVLAVIGLVNGVVNIVNEFRAYGANQSGDPALAMRLSDQNTLQTVLRQGNICDEDDSGWLNNHVGLAKDIALGIDIVEFSATVCVLVKDGYKLYKNAAKWATANGASSFRDATKLALGGLKNNFSELGKAIKLRDLSKVEDILHFKYNFNNSFFNFGTAKDGASTIKNYVGLAKDLFKGGFNLKNIMGTGFKDIVIPNITVFTVAKDTPTINTSGIGTRQFFFDFDEHIKLDKFYSIGDKINSKIIDSSIFKGPAFDCGIMDKLSSITNVSVAFSQ